MTVTPQLRVDMTDWPELAPAISKTIRTVTDLMQLFALQSIRRYRKTVAPERQTTDDAIARMPLDVPQSIAAVRFEVGRSLLDLLDAVGVGGVDLTLDDTDLASLRGYWASYGRPSAADTETPGNAGVDNVVDMSGIGDRPVQEKPRQEPSVKTIDAAGAPVQAAPSANDEDNAKPDGADRHE